MKFDQKKKKKINEKVANFCSFTDFFGFVYSIVCKANDFNNYLSKCFSSRIKYKCIWHRVEKPLQLTKKKKEKPLQ